MPKDDIKIIKLDPLAEKLDKAGFKGGASRRISKPKKLSKEGKAALKQATKDNLKYSRYVSKVGLRGDFGSPMMSRSTAKKLKTAAKEKTLKSELDYPIIANFPKNISTKAKDEARKYLKKKKVEYQKDAKFFQKRGLSNGGLIKGFPKLAKRGY
jgi:hypothetical protein